MLAAYDAMITNMPPPYYAMITDMLPPGHYVVQTNMVPPELLCRENQYVTSELRSFCTSSAATFAVVATDACMHARARAYACVRMRACVCVHAYACVRACVRERTTLGCMAIAPMAAAACACTSASPKRLTCCYHMFVVYNSYVAKPAARRHHLSRAATGASAW